MNIVVKMIAALALIGIISGALLSQISGWAEPQIAVHRQEATEHAIYLVLPGAKDYKKIETVDYELYEALDGSGNSVGYALPIEGNGFQGKIRLMVGVKDDLKQVTGLKILEQVETPGLGAKVSEDNFTKQFTGISSVPQVEWVKGVAPSKDNEIQAITGATISSKSVVAIINDGLAQLRSAEEGGKL